MAITPSLQHLHLKSFREISRLLTVVENELEGADDILVNLKIQDIPVVGITGPPGVGKSTLIARLIDALSQEDKKVAVLAVDPTSPFTSGSLLGDRIRMQNYSAKPGVYIRSVASRGELGGLAAKIVEMTDVLKSSGFDYILIETVGVGQSEIEIAGLADTTLVVLVPESGDEIQSIKAGIMEIGDAFIVNKADRDGADKFAENLKRINYMRNISVFKTVATTAEGITEILAYIKDHQPSPTNKMSLLAKKAWRLIQQKRMADIDINNLQQEITEAVEKPAFNLYRFAYSKVTNS